MLEKKKKNKNNLHIKMLGCWTFASGRVVLAAVLTHNIDNGRRVYDGL